MKWNGLTRREALIGLTGIAIAKAVPTTERLAAGKSIVEVDLSVGPLDLPRTAVIAWIEKAVQAVTAFYGRFPVAEARVEVKLVEGRSTVFNGVTFGRVPTLTRISVGEHISQAALDEDWVATHELVHLAFPSVPRRNHWIEEGLSTYVEPLARLHLRQITEDVFWRDMIRDMPQGQPKQGDRGLDNTHTWGRTYWGGAIYCLQAEVAIRERTNNKKGLQQALRGILNKAGSIQEDVEIEAALKAGDHATGTTVLTDFYGKMKDQALPADLDGTWRDLGLSMRDGRVGYDDRARLAAIRRAITAAPKS